MSSFIQNILQQKLAEIKNGLPPQVVSKMASSTPSFSEVLSQETTIGESTDTITQSGTASSSTKSKSAVAAAEYDAYINEASKKYNISPKLIKAVIMAESSFNPNCVSSAGAQGLMQLMPATAEGLGVKNAFDPAQNINGGAKYLSYQLKRFDGNIELALAAYNAGPNAVIKYGGVPPYTETQNYVKKVLNYMSLF